MKEDRSDPLIEEALRWLVLMRDEAPADRAGFAAWLAQGPAQQAAWERAQYTWARIDSLAPALRARPSAMPAGVGRTAAASMPGRRMARREWMAAAAAAGVAAASYAVVPAGLLADHRTGIGERLTVTLPDGSVVELGSGTALSVDFEGGIRALTLHEGEAFFTAAPDREHPFRVTAANGLTEALGTAFNVKRTDDRVTVSVSEHAVAVSAGDGPALHVEQGRQLRYGPQGVEGIVDADPLIVQAWRRDRLVFHDAPLSEVVAELERFRLGRILVTDRKLGSLPVTAVFDVHQSDAALRTIAEVLPVRVRHATGLLVLISPAG